MEAVLDFLKCATIDVPDTVTIKGKTVKPKILEYSVGSYLSYFVSGEGESYDFEIRVYYDGEFFNIEGKIGERIVFENTVPTAILLTEIKEVENFLDKWC